MIAENNFPLKRLSLGSEHEVKRFTFFVSVRRNNEASYNEGWNPTRREFSMSWQRCDGSLTSASTRHDAHILQEGTEFSITLFLS